MNLSTTTLLLSLLSLVLISCNERNTRDIRVSGSIIDSLSGQPIKNAKITVLCWYDAGYDKTDYETQDITTDTNGSYEATFEEGYKVIVAGIAPKYNKALQEVDDLTNSKVKVNFELRMGSTATSMSEVNLKDYILSKTNSL